jgi:hypothetical protein
MLKGTAPDILTGLPFDSRTSSSLHMLQITKIQISLKRKYTIETIPEMGGGSG